MYQPFQFERSNRWTNSMESLDDCTADIRHEQCIMYHVMKYAQGNFTRGFYVFTLGSPSGLTILLPSLSSSTTILQNLWHKTRSPLWIQPIKQEADQETDHEQENSWINYIGDNNLMR